MVVIESIAVVVFVVLLVKYGKFQVMTKDEFAEYKKQHHDSGGSLMVHAGDSSLTAMSGWSAGTNNTDLLTTSDNDSQSNI